MALHEQRGAAGEGPSAARQTWPGTASDSGVVEREGLEAAGQRARPRLEVVSADVESPADAFRLWRDDVWRFLRRLGVPAQRLEDATQDVFIVACRNWLAFEGRSTRKVWVYGIAARVVQQHKRHRSNKEGIGDFSIVEERTTAGQWGSTLGDPFDAAARREASRSLQALLAVLGQSQREVFVLVELEGQNITEAALALGLTPKATERRLERARHKFNKALCRHRVDDERRLR
jgi:RNA polymerase sigma-70 factor (ECF subfamily)